MHRVAISSTGLYVPPHTISNAELVKAFNLFSDLENEKHADAIAAGTRAAVPHSSVEFIEKASGIKQRYVMDKEGVLDPTRMLPRLQARPDNALSLMAEIGVAAARDALDRAGKQPSDIDGVICAAANMQRAYPAMAVEIQTALGIQGFGFDMNVACSSATFAIEMAVNAVKTGSARAVLVVDPEITSPDVHTKPTQIPTEGIGIVEAPRGTLTHHYWTDELGRVTKANLIVGTTNNYAPIQMSTHKAAASLIKDGVVNEGLLNMVEMAFRAYDPCFGCATHSLPGEMPLEIIVRDADGKPLEVLKQFC